jgi:hypothetical protein
MLKAILAKLRPEPERPFLPPVKYYEPPKAGMRKRRWGRWASEILISPPHP